jgi:diguanylate cyclase (GGDEF)-like protein
MKDEGIKIQLLLNILDEVTNRFDDLFELKEKLLAETNYKATHDLLTDLYNREAFEREVEKFFQDDTSFCLAFIDLDNFKYVNDTFGHDKGDEILMMTAKIMRNNLKGKDLIARIGGDEFVVAIRDCDKKCAKHLLNELENKIKERFKEYEVSASIGAVIYPTDGKNYKNLLKKADEKMYKVKEDGKGKVIV